MPGFSAQRQEYKVDDVNGRRNSVVDNSSAPMKGAVRDRYAQIAVSSGLSCCSGTSTCCSGADVDMTLVLATRIGYTGEELASIPAGANLGLGCGNPQAIAALRPGETVLDLGSGAGLDSFLAARQVGPSGKVIGVDITAEMIARARENAIKGAFSNVEFRLGEIEQLPVADETVDVILSNCVINLSTDKQSVFREAFRVLRPGGRLAITDVVTNVDIPAEVRSNAKLFSGCVAGAATVAELATLLEEAGFAEIRIQPKEGSRESIREWAPGLHVDDYIVSATIEARKTVS